MSRKNETVIERIEAVRKMTPPPKGRKARKGYASKSDFATTLGVSVATVNRWTKGDGYPEEKNRVKLAKLSRGRYAPDDFQDQAVLDRGKGSLPRRVLALERAVDLIEKRLSGAAAPPKR